MRYLGQAYEVSVPLAPLTAERYQQQLAENFHAMHRQLYGHANPAQRVQLITWRVLAVGRNPLRTAITPCHGGPPDMMSEGPRPMSIRRGIPVWDWSVLAPGVRIEGPAFVDGLGTSLVIPSGTRGMVGESGTIALTCPPMS